MGSRDRRSRRRRSGSRVDGGPGEPARPARPATAVLLAGVAAALGVPEAAFRDGSAALTEHAETAAMLQAWQGLRHRADRQEVLALARALALAPPGGPGQ